MKKENGITLVALVTTIVVLIILAGYSIDTLAGDSGIITKSQQAKENMELAKVEEQTQLNTLYTQLENYEDIALSEEESSQLIELQEKFDTLQAEYNTFRSAIATAITEQGIETASTDTVDVMVENIENLSNANIDTQFYSYGGTNTSVSNTLTCKGSGEAHIFITARCDSGSYTVKVNGITLYNESGITSFTRSYTLDVEEGDTVYAAYTRNTTSHWGGLSMVTP